MTLKQLTFDGQKTTPAKYLWTQEVTTQDGETVLYCDAFIDDSGLLWSTAELCDNANEEIAEELREEQVEAIEEFIKNCEDWVHDYCSSGEYFDGLEYIITENPHRVEENVRQWLKENDYNFFSDDTIDSIVSDVIDAAEFETTGEYCCNPFDVEIESFSVGEYEEQIEIDSHDELCDIDTELLEEYFHSVSTPKCWKCNGKGIDKTTQAFAKYGIDVTRSKFWDSTCCRCNGTGKGNRYAYLYCDPSVAGHWGVSDDQMNDIVQGYADDIELNEDTLKGINVTVQDAIDAGCCDCGVREFLKITRHVGKESMPAIALYNIAENTNLVDVYYDEIISTIHSAIYRHKANP